MIFDTRWLGVDYGEARIGLAVSYGTLAEPLEIISGKDKKLALQKIQKIVEEYQVGGLIVGQSEREMAEASRTFGDWLAQELDLPVEYSDETLSSVSVHKKLRETREKKRQYKGAIDHFAAAEILQQWLDDNV